MIAPQWRRMLIVLLVAGVVRAAMLWGGWDNLREDPDAYTALSQTLAHTGVFGLTAPDGTPTATAFRPPLYPAILSGLSLAIIAVNGAFADPLAVENLHAYRVAVAVLHWGLGLLSVAATYGAACRMLRRSHWSAGEIPTQRAAAVAALLVAIDPILLQSSTRVMTETLATALAALGLLAWAVLVERLQSAANPDSLAAKAAGRPWASALAVGVILGLAYLCRPTFIVWTVLLSGYMAAWTVLARWPRPLAAALPIALVTAVLVGGWTLRNQRQFGQPIWATTHGGYTLLLGNNLPFYQYVQERSLGIAWNPQFFFDRWEARTLADPRLPAFWEPETQITADPAWLKSQPAASDEVAQDRLAYETAKMTIRRDPPGFVRACIYRVLRLWSPLPLRHGGPLSAAIVAVTIFYSLVMLSVLVGLAVLRRQLFQPVWAASLGLVLALLAVHAVYWTDMRMRAPAIPVLAILAAVPLHTPFAVKNLFARASLSKR